MTAGFYVLAVALLTAALRLYLRLARRWGILDQPNERSMHSAAVVRGAGVIVWVAGLLAYIRDGFVESPFFAGLTLVAAVSLADDWRSVRVRYRLLVQGMATAWLISHSEVGSTGVLIPVAGLLAGVGVLNAWNFMDGINGLTALYGLLTVGTLWLLSNPETGALLPLTVAALFLFAYYNVRARAVCFAGDVGSLSVGFVVLFGLLQLIGQTHSYLPLLLLAVYGVDTGLTLGYRLRLGQNPLRAHRLHLFQRLVYQGGQSQVRVSVAYALTQAGINAGVGWGLQQPAATQALLAVGVVFVLCAVYGTLTHRLAQRAQKKSAQPGRLQAVS